jgi:type IV pilus assembly protein PilQ
MAHRVSFRITVLCFVTLLFCFSDAAFFDMGNAKAEQLAYAAPGPYRITEIKTSQSADGTILRVSGSTPPTFTMYELFEPQRVILDIADGSFADSLNMPMKPAGGPITQINGKVLDDKEPVIARLEMLTAGEAAYTVERDVNDILISFKKESVKVAAKTEPKAAPKKKVQEAPVIAAPAKKAPPLGTQKAKPVDEPKDKEPSTAETRAVEQVQPKASKEMVTGAEVVSIPSSPPAPVEPSPVMDEFGYAGYDKQAITVDFYKIDLHNVFRLFGEISGLNIVIAQGVSGTITLALDNVPWDFVLDVILNLKNLQAEERFNTLVISPKAMNFDWPERQAENLAVKKDAVVFEESLKVVKKMEMPPEELDSRKLMRQARAMERAEEYDEALDLYEKAFEIWPNNAKVANRLASLYLVQMGMNAKAVYYGKEALKIDEKDRNSALYAAIGLANMKRLDEAKEYFDMAVSGDRPASDALMSYAMFSEDNQNYLEALLLLSHHEDLYGDSLDTMIARARIFDKEGNSAKANAEYRAILLSGYQMPPDLTRYIKGRLAMESSKTQGN